MTNPKVNEFQIELAKIAGLDPAVVRELNVDLDTVNAHGDLYAHVQATVVIAVNPDAVIALAMKHNKIRVA